MAQRTEEELDRLEEARQRHLARAKGQVKGVALLLVALALLIVWIGGYAKGRADGAERCGGNTSLSSAG
jgi:hypothetical protein